VAQAEALAAARRGRVRARLHELAQSLRSLRDCYLDTKVPRLREALLREAGDIIRRLRRFDAEREGRPFVSSRLDWPRSFRFPRAVPPPAASRRSPLVVLLLTVFIDLMGFGIVIPLLPIYAEQMHATPFAAGVLIAVYSAMQLVFAPVWGRLSDRVGRRPV